MKSGPLRQLRTLIQPHVPLFWAGLILKLVLGALLASDFLTRLFGPFVEYAATESFTGAYAHFDAAGQGNAFPYPPLMLALLAVPRYILGLVQPGGGHALTNIIAIRLVLLLADVTILYVLLQWFKQQARKVLWLYWLSPVLLYINFIHGQLDVIPVAFLLLSLHTLFKNRLLRAALLLGLAVCCKTSILLAVPFMCIYVYKSNHISRGLWWRGLAVFALVLVACNAFFIADPHFRGMVYNNAEQVKLFLTSLPVTATLQFLVVPAAYLLLVIRFAGYWHINRTLLLMYLGFAFGIITIFIAPMQGWYYWCLPFFIYFLIKENRYTRLPFLLMTGFYFLYFMLVPGSDFATVWQLVNPDARNAGTVYAWLQQRGLNAPLYVNIAATLLQTSMLAFCWFLYRYGISQMRHYKILHQPCLIGISGDSASGKTTLAGLIEATFGKADTSVLNGDDLHRWERGHPQWQEFTHLNPRANLLHLNLLHSLRLKNGRDVERRQYNHESGRFSPARTIPFKRLIVFEGLHSFYLGFQQQLYDLRIFMQPDEALRTEWKLQRDTAERGHSTEAVLLAIEQRRADASAFVEQQARVADMIIAMRRQTDNSLWLRIGCQNHIDMDDIAAALQNSSGLTVAHEYEAERQVFSFYGDCTAETVAGAGAALTAQLDEMGFEAPQWQAGFDGIVQLFVLQALFYNMHLHAATHGDGMVY